MGKSPAHPWNKEIWYDKGMEDKLAPPKPIRLNKQKIMFMDLWTNPESKTFGNTYKSGLAAGFSPNYARNLQNAAPKWLVSFMDKMQLEQEHIIQGVQRIATGRIDSRSVDDTRLKAYEILGNWSGLNPQSKGQTTNIIVQPILNGESVKRVTVDQTP